jgi:hypothetical protein
LANGILSRTYRLPDRIEPVGLCQDPDRLGEQAGAQRIDDRNAIAARMEASMQLPMPFAGRLNRNQVDVMILKLALEEADALAGYFEPAT